MKYVDLGPTLLFNIYIRQILILFIANWQLDQGGSEIGMHRRGGAGDGVGEADAACCHRRVGRSDVAAPDPPFFRPGTIRVLQGT